MDSRSVKVLGQIAAGTAAALGLFTWGMRRITRVADETPATAGSVGVVPDRAAEQPEVIDLTRAPQAR